MAPKRSRHDGSSRQHSAVDAGKEALCTSLNDAVNASVEKAFEAIELEDQKHEEKRARLFAQAQTAAAKVKSDAAIEVDEMRRKVQEERAALEADKASDEQVMDKASLDARAGRKEGGGAVSKKTKKASKEAKKAKAARKAAEALQEQDHLDMIAYANQMLGWDTSVVWKR
jgi:hypothetical protein